MVKQGDVIRTAREALGLSLAEVAEAAGIRTVSRIAAVEADDPVRPYDAVLVKRVLRARGADLPVPAPQPAQAPPSQVTFEVVDSGEDPVRVIIEGPVVHAARLADTAAFLARVLSRRRAADQTHAEPGATEALPPTTGPVAADGRKVPTAALDE